MESARQNGVNLVSHQDCDTGTCKRKRTRRREAIRHAFALNSVYYDGPGETLAGDFMARTQGAIDPAFSCSFRRHQ